MGSGASTPAGAKAKAARGVSGKAGLPAAAKDGDLKEVERLLRYGGLDVNQFERSTGNTALHYAAAIGHDEIVDLLLNEGDLEVNFENAHRTTALILAAGNGNIHIIESLLRDPRVDPNLVSTTGMAAIHMAAQRGRLLSMRALLKHKGLDINLKTPFAHGAETGLHIAARLGKSKVVRCLLQDERLDVGAINRARETAALVAREVGQAEVADLIMAREKQGYSAGPSGPYNPEEGRGSFYNRPNYAGTERESRDAEPAGAYRLPASPGEGTEHEQDNIIMPPADAQQPAGLGPQHHPVEQPKDQRARRGGTTPTLPHLGPPAEASGGRPGRTRSDFAPTPGNAAAADLSMYNTSAPPGDTSMGRSGGLDQVYSQLLKESANVLNGGDAPRQQPQLFPYISSATGASNRSGLPPGGDSNYEPPELSGAAAGREGNPSGDWQSVPGLNFHNAKQPPPGKASGKWQDEYEGSVRDSGVAPAPGAHQPEKSKGFLGAFGFSRMSDKLDEMRAAQHVKNAEKERRLQAEAAEKERIKREQREAAELAMQNKLEETLKRAAEAKIKADQEKLRAQEEKARQEAVLRSKKEAEAQRKKEAEDKKAAETAAKKAEAERKKREAQEAKTRAAEAKMRKQQEDKARKDAEARKERNASGAGTSSSWGGSATASARAPSKKDLEKMWKTHEAEWEKFENNPPSSITQAAVPWPPDEENILRGMVQAAGGDAKKVYRKATMRWHPDKFMGKYGSKLHASDKDQILERVKSISQTLNRAWQTNQY